MEPNYVKWIRFDTEKKELFIVKFKSIIPISRQFEFNKIVTDFASNILMAGAVNCKRLMAALSQYLE